MTGPADSPLPNAAAVGVAYHPPGTATPPAEASAGVFDPSAHTVADVLDHLAAHPDDADRVLAAEQTGRARAGIIGAP